ncbi:DUF4910 domain-containing protein [Kordiimonas aestuarii]|uniref:DUF4910 domain-containing protein n=1 Tax=Kordiimonas aestuarii TaxID=1005925 RepID=UPI0021D228B4|nr:DUF4910 domain-containing protein [Kordiimonas aestuarii]
MFDKFPSDHALIDKAFDALFPMFRSITGPGLEASIDYFRQFMPLETEKVPTGSKVFDWTVPPEWHCRRARLWGPAGEVICDTDVSNLSVVNYSEPIDASFSLDELEPHLFSLPDLPDAVPYVTSYYKRTWGFCLPHKRRTALKAGKYRVLIESEFRDDGGVPFATCVLPGESEREIMLTSYLCHPSLANNELSGPLALLALYRRLSKWERRRYSYRFVLNPETIGSLCFLSRYHEHLKAKLEAGFIVTCIGGNMPRIRYKASRQGTSSVDTIMRRLHDCKEFSPLPISYTDFTPVGGSDERQYCAPGFNLPMGQLARSAYDEYDGYHNSLDDKTFMDVAGLVKGVDTIENALQLIEMGGKPVNLSPYGEPQLGKRGLYPNLNADSTRRTSTDTVEDGRVRLERMMWILNLADGRHSVSDMADICKCSMEDLRPVIERLEAENLLSFHAEPLAP